MTELSRDKALYQPGDNFFSALFVVEFEFLKRPQLIQTPPELLCFTFHSYTQNFFVQNVMNWRQSIPWSELRMIHKIALLLSPHNLLLQLNGYELEVSQLNLSDPTLVHIKQDFSYVSCG